MTQHHPPIAQVVLDLPIDGPFDYSIPDHLSGQVKVGQRVHVIFNRRKHVAFVVALKSKSELTKLNSIFAILDQDGVSMGESTFLFTKEFSLYYGCSHGQAITLTLPPVLRKSKKVECPSSKKMSRFKNASVSVVHALDRSLAWDQMIEKIDKTLKNKKSIIFLVPEAMHLSEAVDRLKENFPKSIIPLKPKLPVAAQVETWQRVKDESACIVVGTRSAIFAPVSNLGLIIVLDEENSAYSEEQSPHYHVRDVALIRHKVEMCNVVFVSRAPTVEIWHQIKKQGWSLQVCGDDSSLASARIADMSNYNPRKTSIISYPLQNYIKQALDEKQQVVLIVSPRDFHSWVLPENGEKIRAKAEKIEGELDRFYPDARVSRFDAVTKTTALKADIVISTTMILKHHKRLRASLIGVINADAQLNFFDFRGAHKIFSTLIHMRQCARQNLVIQTRMRDQYFIKAALKENFKMFYREELKIRKELGFPPYKHMLNIYVRGPKQGNVDGYINDIENYLNEHKLKSIEVAHSYTNVSLKLQDKSRASIMLKGSSVSSLLKLTKAAISNVKKRNKVITTFKINP